MIVLLREAEETPDMRPGTQDQNNKMAAICGRLATQPGKREVGSEDRERLGHRTCKTRHFKGFDTERARLGTF